MACTFANCKALKTLVEAGKVNVGKTEDESDQPPTNNGGISSVGGQTGGGRTTTTTCILFPSTECLALVVVEMMV